MAGTITLNFNPGQWLGKLLNPSQAASQPTAAQAVSSPSSDKAPGAPTADRASFGMLGGVWLTEDGKQCATVYGYGNDPSIPPGSAPSLVRAFIGSLLDTHVGAQFGNAGPDPSCHLTAFALHGTRVRAVEMCEQGQGHDYRKVVGHYVITMNGTGTQGTVVEHEVSTDAGKVDYRGTISLYSRDPHAQPPRAGGCSGDVLANSTL